MILEVKRQDSYSRGELLLRSFFGFFYIATPHLFLLVLFSIVSSVYTFIAFWSILFTGRYPQSMFEFQVKLNRWSLRVNARLYNLSDGYPSFGLDGTDENTNFEMEYPESLSRGTLLLKAFFGAFYCAFPHAIVLIFRIIATYFLAFLAWWSVLFTGSYPESWHRFNVGTLRWSMRVNLYLTFMTDDYPPFSGK